MYDIFFYTYLKSIKQKIIKYFVKNKVLDYLLMRCSTFLMKIKLEHY